MVRRATASHFTLSDFKVSYPTCMKWKCQKCSVCCQDTVNRRRHVMLLAIEGNEISKGTGIPIEQFASKTSNETYSYEMLKNNGACRFLAGNTCLVYDHRPLVCVFYPFEMKNEGDSLKILLTGGDCPGIGRGEKLQETFFRRLAETAIGRLKSADSTGSPSTPLRSAYDR